MRKIALVTSTRAEYGIMSRLIEALDKDTDIDFYLLVTGMHLSEKFGMTKNEITQNIYKEINIEIEKEPSHLLFLAMIRVRLAHGVSVVVDRCDVRRHFERLSWE